MEIGSTLFCLGSRQIRLRQRCCSFPLTVYWKATKQSIQIHCSVRITHATQRFSLFKKCVGDHDAVLLAGAKHSFVGFVANLGDKRTEHAPKATIMSCVGMSKTSEKTVEVAVILLKTTGSVGGGHTLIQESHSTEVKRFSYSGRCNKHCSVYLLHAEKRGFCQTPLFIRLAVVFTTRQKKRFL